MEEREEEEGGRTTWADGAATSWKKNVKGGELMMVKSWANVDSCSHVQRKKKMMIFGGQNSWKWVGFSETKGQLLVRKKMMLNGKDKRQLRWWLSKEKMPSNDGDKNEIRKADSTVNVKLRVMVNREWKIGSECWWR